MKKFLFLIAIIILGDLILSRCASPGNPTGGSKDTIPPTLLNSEPINGSLKFSESTIHLEFSEYVNADKLTQNLIVTPKTDTKFKYLAKKNILDIKFEKPFSDNTTYRLNFFEGVTDITEHNPAINLVLAFSTGNFIDSMQVSGAVKNLLTQEPSKKFTVGLYPISDTLDFLAHSPQYFTTTSDSGTFDISYIKTGLYKIMSFNDNNKNLLLDSEEEAHGFLSDTIRLFTVIDSLSIPTLLQNIKLLQIINNQPTGAYHEIKFNKHVDKYSIEPDSIFNTLVGENKEILRLYNSNQFSFGDSTTISIKASDSLSNTITDTLKIVFLESRRKAPKLSSSLVYNKNALTDNPSYIIKFNKPIVTLDTSRFIYKADSTFTFKPDSISFQWNQNKTQLKLTTYLIKDTLYNRYAKSISVDTLVADSITLARNDSTTLRSSSQKEKKKKASIEFFTLSGAFISVENDSSKTESIKHRRVNKEKIGILKLNLTTNKNSFIVQLLDKSDQVKYEIKNVKTPVFKVTPGNYKIRILIDSNNDGTWSYGNLIKNEEPEQILFFEEELSVRENWIVGEDISISF